MAVFVLAYDLVKKKPEFDYEVLWDELRRLGAHRVQESLWVANLNNTAEEVLEHFQGFVHKDDRLWVSSIRKNEYWYCNAITGTNAWFTENPAT